MATSYGNISVVGTATLILSADAGRRGCLIGNNASVPVFIGPDANITTANAMPLAPGGTFVNSDQYAAFKGAIYGIVSTGSADVRFWDWTP